jgi:small subunit ribosomal protein S19
MVRSLWKGPFIKNNILKQVYLKKDKNYIKIWSRSSMIFPCFVGLTFEVYNGKGLVAFLVKKNMVGLKFGEFVLTRKITKHKK